MAATRLTCVVACLCSAAAVGSIAACGDERGEPQRAPTSSPAPERGPALSKQEFIRRADAVCAGIDRSDERPQTLDQAADVYRDLADDLERAVDAIDALRAPRQDREVLETYLDLQRRDIESVRRMEGAAARGDDAAVRSHFADIGKDKERARQLAQQYGFRLCGSG